MHELCATFNPQPYLFVLAELEEMMVDWPSEGQKILRHCQDHLFSGHRGSKLSYVYSATKGSRPTRVMPLPPRRQEGPTVWQKRIQFPFLCVLAHGVCFQ